MIRGRDARLTSDGKRHAAPQGFARCAQEGGCEEARESALVVRQLGVGIDQVLPDGMLKVSARPDDACDVLWREQPVDRREQLRIT